MNKVFTREELKQFNGLNKKLAYVAFDGQVYDVSNIFKNGEHYKIKAGTDITDVFKQSPHGLDIFSKAPVVGRLKTESTFLQLIAIPFETFPSNL